MVTSSSELVKALIVKSFRSFMGSPIVSLYLELTGCIYNYTIKDYTCKSCCQGYQVNNQYTITPILKFP